MDDYEITYWAHSGPLGHWYASRYELIKLRGPRWWRRLRLWWFISNGPPRPHSIRKLRKQP